MSKKNIGIFGGSFNPVHYGHLDVVNQLLEKDFFDAIWFLPVGVHPNGKELIDPVHRMRMVELAISHMDDPRVGISYEEIGLNGKNYTYNTLESLSKIHPALSFGVILGSDQLRHIEQWYNAEKLLSEFKFTTFLRGNDFPNQTIRLLFKKYSMNVAYVDARAISASDIRDNIYTGKSISAFVPPSVNSYIMGNELYRSRIL